MGSLKAEGKGQSLPNALMPEPGPYLQGAGHPPQIPGSPYQNIPVDMGPATKKKWWQPSLFVR